MITIHVAYIITIGLSCFALGMSLANLLLGPSRR